MIGCLHIPAYASWALHYLETQCTNTLPAGLVALEAGQVVSVTKQARRAGIVAGMTRAEAEQKNADVHLAERDERVEAAVWVDVMQRLNAYTPRIRSVAPGLLYFAPGDEERLQAYIEALGGCAALAPDRPAARLGVLDARPGEIVQLSHRHTAMLLDRLRMEQLLRLDFPLSMVDHLQEAGYDTLSTLQEASQRWLQAQFGTHGKRLYKLLHPSRVDRAPVPLYTAPATVMRAVHWNAPAAYWGTLQPATARLLSQAVSALGAQTCQRITVQLVDANSGAVRRESQLLRTPTRARGALSPVAHRLLRTLMCPNLEVETLRVTLGVLSIPEVYPDVFFRQTPRPRRAASSRMSLASVADSAVPDGLAAHGEVVGDDRAEMRR